MNIENLANTTIECIKDVTDLGYADFIAGKSYWIESIDKSDNTVYIESEDGNCVMFELGKLKKYFNIK